jgi:hypothetical protein
MFQRVDNGHKTSIWAIIHRFCEEDFYPSLLSSLSFYLLIHHNGLIAAIKDNEIKAAAQLQESWTKLHHSLCNFVNAISNLSLTD